MARSWVSVLAALVLPGGLVASACSRPAPPRPPTVAPPEGIDDVVGIWRTIHRHTLQLRAKGTYVLLTGVTPPLAGTYRLDGDRIEMADRHCGPITGRYVVRVAPRERLELTPELDTCEDRRVHLTLDPWVYGDP
jgi:hypothetical protein